MVNPVRLTLALALLALALHPSDDEYELSRRTRRRPRFCLGLRNGTDPPASIKRHGNDATVAGRKLAEKATMCCFFVAFTMAKSRDDLQEGKLRCAAG